MTIPNDSDPAYLDTEFQSRIFQADLDILEDAIAGRNGVVGGCEVTLDAPTGMSVAVASGTIGSAGVSYSITGDSVTIADSDTTDPRFDLVIARDTGAVDVITGTADESPVMPSPREVPGSVALAGVYVPASASVVGSSQIVDKRVTIPPPFEGTAFWTTVEATADSDKTSNATLGEDAELKFVMAANTKYRIRLKVWFSLAVFTTGNGPKIGIGGPASPTVLVGRGFWWTQIAASISLGSLGATSVLGTTAYDTSTGYNQGASITALNSKIFVEMDFIVHNGANTGNFALWWSQVTANTQTIRRLAGSYLEYAAVA